MPSTSFFSSRCASTTAAMRTSAVSYADGQLFLSELWGNIEGVILSERPAFGRKRRIYVFPPAQIQRFFASAALRLRMTSSTSSVRQFARSPVAGDCGILETCADPLHHSGPVHHCGVRGSILLLPPCAAASARGPRRPCGAEHRYGRGQRRCQLPHRHNLSSLRALGREDEKQPGLGCPPCCLFICR